MLDSDSTTTRISVAEPLTSPSRLLTAAKRLPWWGTVLALYGLSRAFSSAILFVMYRVAATNPGGYADGYVDDGSSKGFFGFLGTIWDARYYVQIAQHGYPHQLPVNEAGAVVSNAWAFLPTFPWLMRIVAQITGWDTGAVGVGLATVFGALAALALYRILRLRLDELGTVWGVVFFCFGPMAFLLQVGYAESLFLFLMFSGLYALMRRRYVTLMWCGVIASFTRPGALALALALLIVVVQRFWKERDDFPAHERASAVVAGVAIGAAGLAWPLIAAAITGDPNAYLKTEMSWWVQVLGYEPEFLPLSPWFIMTTHFLGILGAVVVLAIAALWIYGMRKPSLKRLGFQMRTFLTSYALYLLAVFLPQQSIARLLMPLAPLVAVDSITHKPLIRRLVLASAMALQVSAAVTLWLTGPP